MCTYPRYNVVYRVSQKNCSQLSTFFSFFLGFGVCHRFFFILTYSIDLPKTCSRPLADLWYLAPETPESRVKIFHNFMDFHQYLFFPGIFRGAIAPQRRGILSCFRWYMQILSKPIGKKVRRLGPVAGPKRPIFFLAIFDLIWVYHLKQRKIPRRWPKGLLCKVRITCTKWF